MSEERMEATERVVRAACNAMPESPGCLYPKCDCEKLPKAIIAAFPSPPSGGEVERLPLLKAQLADIEDTSKKWDSLYAARIRQIIEDIRAEMVSAAVAPATPSLGGVLEAAAKVIEKKAADLKAKQAADYPHVQIESILETCRQLAEEVRALPASAVPMDGGGGSLLTADEVMAEVESVASEPVKKALRLVYDGGGRPSEKGKIADVALRDLALEPVTMYRRKVPKDEAPIYQRRSTPVDPPGTTVAPAPVKDAS